MTKKQKYDRAVLLKKKRDWISMVYPEDSSWAEKVKNMPPRQVCAIFDSMIRKIRGDKKVKKQVDEVVTNGKLITIFDIYNRPNMM